MQNINKNTMKIVISMLLAIATGFLHMFAQSCNFNFNALTIAEPSFLYFLYTIMLFMLYKSMFSIKNNNMINISAIIWGVCISILFEYRAYNKLGSFFSSPLKILFLIIFVFINCLLARAILVNLFAILEKEVKSGKSSFLPKYKYALIIAAVWLIYYICVFPGIIQYDSGTMLQIVHGIQPPSNDNPLFQTAILWFFVQIGNIFNSATLTVSLIVLMQITLLSWLFAEFFNRMDNLSLPKSLRNIALAFVCISPVFPNYVCALGKDILFGMAIMWFMLNIFDFTMEGEAYLNKKTNIVKIFLSCLLMCLLRNAGMYFAILCLIMLFVYGFKHYKKSFIPLSISGISAVLLYILALNIAISSFNISPEKKSANLSIPLQQIARTLNAYGEDSMTDEEKQSISKIIDTEKAAQAYNSEISDRVKDLYSQNATKQEISDFFKAWKSMGKRYSDVYIKATLYNSFGYYVPGITCSVKSIYFWDYNNVEALKGVFEPMNNNPLIKIAQSYTATISRLPFFDYILSTGFIQIFHIFALLIILFTKKYKYLLLVLPSILFGIGLIASPVNAYFRYSLPTFFLMILSFIACLQAMKETNIK